MIFNSISYLLFLPIVLIAYYTFPFKIRWLWLLVASIGYYLSFIPIFLILLAVIVCVNYLMAIWLSMVSDKRSGHLFVAIIVMNLIILAFFKYFNVLFPDNQLHLYNVDLFFRVNPINKMILPLGLSYIIFTVLSYQIEVKRKNIIPEKHFGYFSLYLFFFPKIAQGPIERPQQLIPQLHQTHHFNYTMIVEGLKLMLWGYFKKLVIADRLAIYVNAVYNNSEHHNGNTLILATIFFAFQIYADFSGYTDIALGTAKLFGFNLTNNFRRPYFATSIKDFWDRWHITFSTWLRDYLFLPVAYFLANKMSKPKYLFVSTDKWIYLIAIMITFSICGIWHGVGWTYLIWGILFGIYLTYSNWTGSLHKKLRKRLHIKKISYYYLIYKTILTFILVLFAWIFFRADNIKDSFNIIRKILTFNGTVFLGDTFEVINSLIFSFFGIGFLLIIELKEEYFSNTFSFFNNTNWIIRNLSYALLIISIILFGVFDGGQFIYFQF